MVADLEKKYWGVSKNSACIVQNLLDGIACKLTFSSSLDGSKVICQVLLHTCQQMPTTSEQACRLMSAFDRAFREPIYAE